MHACIRSFIPTLPGHTGCSKLALSTTGVKVNPAGAEQKVGKRTHESQRTQTHNRGHSGASHVFADMWGRAPERCARRAVWGVIGHMSPIPATPLRPVTEGT